MLACFNPLQTFQKCAFMSLCLLSRSVKSPLKPVFIQWHYPNLFFFLRCIIFYFFWRTISSNTPTMNRPDTGPVLTAACRQQRCGHTTIYCDATGSWLSGHRLCAVRTEDNVDTYQRSPFNMNTDAANTNFRYSHILFSYSFFSSIAQ